MITVFLDIIRRARNFFEVASYPLLFAVALILISVLPQARKERGALVSSNLMFILVIFFPVSATVLLDLIGRDVFYRVFWMLSIPIVIAYACVTLTYSFSKKAMRAVAVVAASALILLTGSSVLTGDYFTAPQNNLKLPTEPILVADAISADAEALGIESPKAVVPADLCVYIRQYDASIRLAYGRNMAKGDKKKTKLYEEINSYPPKPKRLARLARKAECDYIVLASGVLEDEDLMEYGFTRVTEAAGYTIYYDTEKARAG